ncbi:complement C1q-like protein 2 isoform X2 [Esox lucius]|uniref:complement C1q-like protein 2 isoform X2 n=1 Tax=Esox lucius TaxID=8010 RepID=UPI0014776C24|nr:complement C1q-like protein 2 isoform X2 [Esox lucius]
MRVSAALLVVLCGTLTGAQTEFPESSDGKPLIDQAEPIKDANQQEKEDILAQLRKMESQLEILKAQAETKVAFSVGLGGTGYYGPFNTDVTIVYPIVLTNIGNAYNTATGIFTAPVGGVYHFTVYHHSGKDRRSDSMLYKNHDQIAFISALNKDGSYNGSNGVILQLEKGDVVYVRLMADSWLWDHVNNVPHHGSKGWCHFNGILLFAE